MSGPETVRDISAYYSLTYDAEVNFDPRKGIRTILVEVFNASYNLLQNGNDLYISLLPGIVDDRQNAIKKSPSPYPVYLNYSKDENEDTYQLSGVWVAATRGRVLPSNSGVLFLPTKNRRPYFYPLVHKIDASLENSQRG